MGREIIVTARRFIGAKYRHQGRGPHHFDCIGFPACVARELGLTSKGDGRLLELHDQTDYKPIAGIRSLYKELRKHLHVVPTLSEARDGDLLFFYLTEVAHTAFLAEGGRRMIHACSSQRKVIEHRLGPWEDKVRAIFRFHEAL